MNFDYSYRAFVITCLLFGIMFLAFKSITLSKYVIENEENYDLEYIEDPIIPEELALIPNNNKIETNRAYNEAEKFISEIEKENDEFSKKIEELDKSLNNNENDANSSNLGNGNSLKGKKQFEKQKNELVETKVKKAKDENYNSKRNSTVSYSLVKRSALDLPNPVYTCFSYGKIVINIEVSDKGDVINTTFNSSASTTNNECLIEAAFDYAKRAKFTTAANKNSQLGTITYNFPGQH